jgi:hypothetical protein
MQVFHAAIKFFMSKLKGADVRAWTLDAVHFEIPPLS